MFMALSAPALAGIIVTAVEGGQERPKLGRNRARWIAFILAEIVYTAMMVIVAMLLVLIDRMWQRLPQEDPAVSHAPRLAVKG